MEQTARGPVPGQDGLGRGLASSIVTVEELFRLGLFRPASVQRDYQWTECNCATLLADLRHVLDAPEPDAAGRKDAASDAASGDDDPVDPGLIPEMVAEAAPLPSYYLGPMVLTSTTPGNAHAAAPENWIDVYDGLQRLTTLTMLIAILRDLTSQPALRERLGSMVMATPKLARLTLRSGNRIMTDEIHPAGAAATVRKPRKGLTPTEHGIRAACGYFRSAVSRWGQSRIDAFAARLLSDACVGVTEVRDARMARQIFVSTNLHGVRLNRVDLFKGQLMDLAPDGAAAGAILAAWDRITRTVAIADPITRVVRDDMDGLLVAVDFIERREHQGVDCLAQLAEHLAKKTRADGIEGWVANLEKFADAWRELHERMGDIHARPIDKQIWKLRFFWWDEWKPLALLWYRDYLTKRGRDGRAPGITWAAFQRRFTALHGRCLAIILADYSPNDRATIFGKAIAQTSHGNDPLKLALAFDPRAIRKMRRSLKVPLTDLDKRLATVQWIEASMWGDDLPAHLASMQVEHVLPQNPEESSEWCRLFPTEGERYDCAHSLGNLACLDPKRNRDLGNADYAAKLAAYNRDPVYKTLQQVAASTFWTRDMIRARENVLVDYVFDRLELHVLAPGAHGRGGGGAGGV